MRLFLLILSLMAAVAVHAQSAAPAPSVAARAWLLLDYGSGQVLSQENADERVEPASLTKLMTAYVSFGALRQGTLKLEQAITVSERAWKAGGSRMFIEPKRPVIVNELLRGMIVQSGNDACIALAEAIAGSEEAFVLRMNHEAQRLGLTNTHFVNTTGLPDPQHYSTARDLARLAQAVIRDFPEYYPLYAEKEFGYNGITQPNRNRLLWLDPAVDGVKTGHTENAGYCLIASAKHEPRRLISVVLGTVSDASRAQESQRLLNFGFQFYDAWRLYQKNQVVSQLRVYQGKDGVVKAGFADDFVLSLPKGAAGRISVQVTSQQPLMAPVQQGQPVAVLTLKIDDKVWGEYSLVAIEAVPLAGFIGRAWDKLLLWWQ
jgi:serine-type D-Ala-D-Ala carboxypeptidase (penicillin-binding protein 5/6)